MHDVVGMQVLHDVREAVDYELALVALQHALLEVVGQGERAILEHDAVLRVHRVAGRVHRVAGRVHRVAGRVRRVAGWVSGGCSLSGAGLRADP